MRAPPVLHGTCRWWGCPRASAPYVTSASASARSLWGVTQTSFRASAPMQEWVHVSCVHVFLDMDVNVNSYSGLCCMLGCKERANSTIVRIAAPTKAVVQSHVLAAKCIPCAVVISSEIHL